MEESSSELPNYRIAHVQVLYFEDLLQWMKSYTGSNSVMLRLDEIVCGTEQCKTEVLLFI